MNAVDRYVQNLRLTVMGIYAYKSIPISSYSCQHTLKLWPNNPFFQMNYTITLLYYQFLYGILIFRLSISFSFIFDANKLNGCATTRSLIDGYF